ncbi:MAG: DUF2232 domain-containing protein [Desulfamplus sp.]|nr:DUF2232 domain-containing protein [Desulfamplus sp.]
MGSIKERLFIELLSGIAISMLIVFVTIYMPLLGFFMAIILPMPILYFRLKFGRNIGATIMFVVLAMIFAATNMLSGSTDPELSSSLIKSSSFTPSIDMLFYGALLLIGFFLGEFIEMRLSIEKSFIYTLFSTVGVCSALFFLYALSTDQGVLDLVSKYVSDNLKLTLALYEDMGMSPESIEAIVASMEAIEYLLTRIIPALVITLLSFILWVNILFIKKILTKKGISLIELESLNLWRAPDYLVWVVIFLGILMMVFGKDIKMIAFNCIMIIMPVYFFQGIAIISFIFEKKGLPTFFQIAIYSIIAIQQVLILAIIGLGFFDTWLNFRKIGVINSSDGQSSDL